MNKVMKAANQAKLPVKARIGRRKANIKGKGPLTKNARTRGTRGKPSQFKKLVKITRTIERGKGGFSLKSRTFIARGGTILRIKKNAPVPLNNEKKILSRLGRKNLQTKNIKNITDNKQVQNLNPLIRKVEFDNHRGLEVQALQNDFMGNGNYVQNDFMGKGNYAQNDFMEDVNYDFKDMITFSKSPLLPTPQVLQRMFPAVQELLHNNPQNFMSKIVENFRENNFSRGSNDTAYPFQRGSYRENEMISNQYRNYGNQNEFDHQISSRDYRPFKNYEQNPEYQRTYDNFSSYQEPFDYHPYYNNMYDQGRINRNYTEYSGRFDLPGNQGTWRRPFFSSRFEENKYGGGGFPFRNRLQTYEGPRKPERNYKSNQGLVGYASNKASQQEKSVESFYSYRPGEKTNVTPKSGISGAVGNSQISSANIGQNSDISYGGSKFYGKVVQTNIGSNLNSGPGPANDAVNKEKDSLEYLQTLRKKSRNLKYSLNTLPAASFKRKQTVLKNLHEVNEELTRLEHKYGHWK